MGTVRQSTLPGGSPDLHPVVAESTIRTVVADVAVANGLGGFVERLMRQCRAESAYRADAHSACDAYGLFQLLEPTARWLGVNRYDWRDNIVGGVKYMAWLLKHYKGDYAKALAGYNWGQGHLDKAIRTYGDLWRDNLPKETSEYLTKIL